MKTVCINSNRMTQVLQRGTENYFKGLIKNERHKETKEMSH